METEESGPVQVDGAEKSKEVDGAEKSKQVDDAELTEEQQIKEELKRAILPDVKFNVKCKKVIDCCFFCTYKLLARKITVSIKSIIIVYDTAWLANTLSRALVCVCD